MTDIKQILEIYLHDLFLFKHKVLFTNIKVEYIKYEDFGYYIRYSLYNTKGVEEYGGMNISNEQFIVWMFNHFENKMNQQLLHELEFNNVRIPDTPQFKIEKLKPLLLENGLYTVTVTKEELEILLKLPKQGNQK